MSVIHVSVINVHVFSDFSNTCVYHNWQILHVHVIAVSVIIFVLPQVSELETQLKESQIHIHSLQQQLAAQHQQGNTHIYILL